MGLSHCLYGTTAVNHWGELPSAWLLKIFPGTFINALIISNAILTGKEQILDLPSSLNKKSASGKEAGKDQRFNQLSQSSFPLGFNFSKLVDSLSASLLKILFAWAAYTLKYKEPVQKRLKAPGPCCSGLWIRPWHQYPSVPLPCSA